ncbi:MAG TPA: type IVB secretion system protein IcmH/DotU [Burkholderiales bacterium]|nr:type IVB secretion system protein IcmH/DotU [Burkholderiales bacterium]
MSQDDPFAIPEEDRTLIRPAPGGRRPIVTASIPATQTAAPLSAEDLGRVGALNPLVGAANPLLALAMQLRNSPTVGDLQRLRDTLTRSIREFEANARTRSVRTEVVIAARYCLCTFLDEVIATTPWGAGGTWANNSLLVSFHNESWGGEKFFALLKRVGEDPRTNVDLLELMYLCLAFGLEGKYRVIEGGRSQLEELRERLYLTIRAQRGEPEGELSPHWQGLVRQKKTLTSWVPLWVGTAVVAGVLLLVYLGLSWILSGSSDPVYAALHDIPDKFTPAAPSGPPRSTDLSTLLQPDIAAGTLSVTELGDRAIARLRGDNLFESGSASINPQYHPVLGRVAEALRSTSGTIVISGHTDDRKIFSARFPSNWDLSKARADAVLSMLAPALGDSRRVSAEGRADREPVAPNDTAQHRALNRRVDVTIFLPSSAPRPPVERTKR